MVEISEEQRQALAVNHNQPLPVEDPKGHRHYVLIEKSAYEALQGSARATNGSTEHQVAAVCHPNDLPDWCNVYEGLSEEDLASLEEVILNRSDFTRPM